MMRMICGAHFFSFHYVAFIISLYKWMDENEINLWNVFFFYCQITFFFLFVCVCVGPTSSPFLGIYKWIKNVLNMMMMSVWTLNGRCFCYHHYIQIAKNCGFYSVIFCHLSYMLPFAKTLPPHIFFTKTIWLKYCLISFFHFFCFISVYVFFNVGTKENLIISYHHQ